METGRKRKDKETKKQEREEKRKRAEEEKEQRKRARLEKKEAKKSKPVAASASAVDIQQIRAAAYICSVCDEHGSVNDEENGVEWFGCDGCERWYHDHCLSVSEMWYVMNSLSVERGEWFCKMCKPWVYEFEG